jgi:hypothetical protein
MHIGQGLSSVHWVSWKKKLNILPSWILSVLTHGLFPGIWLADVSSWPEREESICT